MNQKKNSMDSIITLHNCALGSENTLSKIYFDSKGDQTASLSSSSKANFQEIKVEKLDDLFSNTPVSFIKIDTEGFEHEILSGAKSILSKYKPVLCLSAYHKPQDKSVLPSFIQSIRSDYDVKLVNHGEDNLFCS